MHLSLSESIIKESNGEIHIDFELSKSVRSAMAAATMLGANVTFVYLRADDEGFCSGVRFTINGPSPEKTSALIEVPFVESEFPVVESSLPAPSP